MNLCLLMSGLEEEEQTKFVRWFLQYRASRQINSFIEKKCSDQQDQQSADLDNFPHLSMGDTSEHDSMMSEPEENAKNVPVKPGQVRLLKGEMVSRPLEITFVLILSQWSGDRWLIAPFSPYMTPATEGELDTKLNSRLYRVLEVWNALVIPDSLLRSQSEFLRDAGENVRMDACTVFFQLLEGKEIPEELRDRVGPSIRFDLDPRIQHLLSEKYQLRPLRRKAQEEERKDDLSGWSFHPLWPEDEMCAAFARGALIAALVAGEEKKTIRVICRIEHHEELLSMICSPNGDAMDMDIRILAEGRKGISTALDGSEIVDADKRVLGSIRDGAFSMQVGSGFDGRIALRTPDGMVCRLKATYLRKGF